MIIELTLTSVEGHLLVRLIEDKITTPKKKTLKKGHRRRYYLIRPLRKWKRVRRQSHHQI